MKTLFLSVIVLLSSFAANYLLAQTPPIKWKADSKLSWDNFEAEAAGKMFEAAKSEFKVDFKYQGKVKEGEMIFEFDVTPMFIPEKSWCNKERATYELLMHEQLHFDITELFARKMRKKFREATFSKDNYEAEIKTLYTKTMTELGNYRSVYNSETFFGAKLDKQLLWNDKVANALNAHADYAQ